MTASEVDLPAAGELAVPQTRLRGVLAKSRRPALVAAGFVACGVVLFLAYLGQAKTMPVASDGASQALQAWDMLHGNVLLRSWSLSDVTFYTTELPQYMLIELVRGLTGSVVHIAAAMTYTLLVLGVAVLAKGDEPGRPGFIRMVIAGGILLAPPLGRHGTTAVVLNFPDHTGTQVPLLLIWLLLDRVRPRWWLPILIAALLTWVQVSDVLALYEGVLPLVVVCGIRVISRRGRLADHWYELSLAAGALLSAYASTQILLAIRRAGGFAFSPPRATFSTVGAMSQKFWEKLHNELVIFGANFFGLPLRHALAPLLHLICVALVIWAVAIGVRHFTRQGSLMVQVLTVTFIALLAAYTFSYHPGAWEAVGLLPAGAVLAGRLLPERLAKANLIAPLAAVLACFVLLLASDSTAPAPSNLNVTIAEWLRAHDLRYGLAHYWHANSITLLTSGQVQVRAISSERNKLVLNNWNTNSGWYNPRLHDATFVIWPRNARASRRSLYGAVGMPVRTYRLGAYVVMVWDHNLLDGPFASGRVVHWVVLAAGDQQQRAIGRLPARPGAMS